MTATGDNISDASYFQACRFINDDNHILPATENPPLPMVTMWDTHGVTFAACKFDNGMTTNTADQRKHAIYSIDASYTLTHSCNLGEHLPPCDSFDESYISGFNQAVYATNGSNNAAPRISATNFSNNMVGIFFDGADFGVAVGNEFNLGGFPFDPEPSEEEGDAAFHLGIRATETSNWIIEENKFFRDSNAGSSLVHGVLIEESGEENLQLYNNEFSNMEAAVVVTGKNASANFFDGLRFICNTNANNNGDFEIRLNQYNEFGVVSSYQSGDGPSSLPNGNTFSAGDGFNTNFVNVDFNSEAHYNFWYDPNAPNQTPSSDEVNVSPGTWNAISISQSNNCTLNYDGVYAKVDVKDIKDEFYDVKSDYYNLRYTYDQFLDNGSTEGVLNDISVNWTEDAWELRDELLALSPYLSDTVLMAAADKNILPDGMLLEVLVANPDGLTNGKVIQHIQCCIPSPLPYHMIEILEAANNLHTARTITERSLSGLHGKMLSIQRRVLSHYRHDSIPVHRDTLLHWHKQNRGLEGRYATAIEHLNRGEFVSAKTVLDSAEVNLMLKGKRQKALMEMRNLVNLLEDISLNSRSIAQLDSTEQATLLAIATQADAGKAGKRARNILCFFYDQCELAPAVPKNAEKPQKKKPRSLTALLNAENVINCYPNPAKDFFQVEYILDKPEENHVLSVHDVLGRKIHSNVLGEFQRGVEVFDTRNFLPGVYIIELSRNGNQVASEKFIKQ